MAGNVSEWVASWYGKNYHNNSPFENPQGPPSGKYHITRGGSWWDNQSFMKFSNRTGRGDDIGFRCVHTETP
jgi:formylglycine-generating enzyme required for sulfatase activity